MSNKLAFMKKAVLYGYQNPNAIVNILNTAVADVVSEIRITGSATVGITETAGGTSAYTAIAYSQYGDAMNNAVVLALKNAVTGVSISGGVATVVGSVAEDTTFVVRATVSGSAVVKEKTVTVVVREVDSIVVSGDASIINDAISGLTTDPYTAIAYDIDSEVVVATLAFALKTPVSGVSINSTTGVVTLTTAVVDATAFTIEVTALNSAVTGELDVVVSVRAIDSIVITGLATLVNSASVGLVSEAYTALALGIDAAPVSATITLTVAPPVSGVSIAEGVVTLTNAVIDGTTFIIHASAAGSAVVADKTITVSVPI